MTQLALFADHAEPITRYPSPIFGEATFDDHRQLRWSLRRWWRAGPYACWIMLNPSDAGAERNDPTMWEVIFHTYRLGFGGLVVVNLYPFISANPAACKRWADYDAPGRGPDWWVRDRLLDNLQLVGRTAKEADACFAAWGASAFDDAWTERVVEEVLSGDAPWPDLLCLGTTADGSPKHPLARGHHRIPRDQQPIVWRSAA